GSAYTGPAEEIPDRLRALDDQLAVFNAHGVHWTTWTYKDVGVMGWVALDPECEYLQRVAPVLEAKRRLDVDFWTGWQPPTPARVIVHALARYAEEVIGDPDINPTANNSYLKQAALSGYVAGLMQPAYAKLFKGLSETEIDRILQSFAFKNCQPRKGLIEVIKKHLA
ncbi:MAG: glycoside hydrolase family 5 protein, partial [Anaerolineae bacterium]